MGKTREQIDIIIKATDEASKVLAGVNTGIHGWSVWEVDHDQAKHKGRHWQEQP